MSPFRRTAAGQSGRRVRAGHHRPRRRTSRWSGSELQIPPMLQLGNDLAEFPEPPTAHVACGERVFPHQLWHLDLHTRHVRILHRRTAHHTGDNAGY